MFGAMHANGAHMTVSGPFPSSGVDGGGQQSRHMSEELQVGGFAFMTRTAYRSASSSFFPAGHDNEPDNQSGSIPHVEREVSTVYQDVNEQRVAVVPRSGVEFPLSRRVLWDRRVVGPLRLLPPESCLPRVSIKVRCCYRLEIIVVIGWTEISDVSAWIIAASSAVLPGRRRRVGFGAIDRGKG